MTVKSKGRPAKRKETIARKRAEERKNLLATVYKHACKGLSYHEIGTLVQLEEDTVQTIITEHFPHLQEIETFKEHKVNLFTGVQQLAVKYLLQKIPFMSGKDLTYLLVAIQDKIQLMTGGSTNNVKITLESLVSEREKVKEKLKEEGVSDYQLEIEMQKRKGMGYEMKTLKEVKTLSQREII